MNGQVFIAQLSQLCKLKQSLRMDDNVGGAEMFGKTCIVKVQVTICLKVLLTLKQSGFTLHL